MWCLISHSDLFLVILLLVILYVKLYEKHLFDQLSDLVEFTSIRFRDLVFTLIFATININPISNVIVLIYRHRFAKFNFLSNYNKKSLFFSEFQKGIKAFFQWKHMPFDLAQWKTIPKTPLSTSRIKNIVIENN